MREQRKQKALKHVRATWLAEKTGVSYQTAKAIINNGKKIKPAMDNKIKNALDKDAKSPTIFKTRNLYKK